MPTKGHIVIPYTQLCESIKKICGRYGITSKVAEYKYWSPKDKDPISTSYLGYNIGETSPLVKDTKSMKAPSAIHHHSSPNFNQNNFLRGGRGLET